MTLDSSAVRSNLRITLITQKKTSKIAIGTSAEKEAEMVSGTCSGILMPMCLSRHRRMNSTTIIVVMNTVNMPLPPKLATAITPSPIGAAVIKKHARETIAAVMGSIL